MKEQPLLDWGDAWKNRLLGLDKKETIELGRVPTGFAFEIEKDLRNSFGLTSEPTIFDDSLADYLHSIDAEPEEHL